MTPIGHLSCSQVFARLDDYLDRELAPDEIERVRLHLEACAVCAAELRFEESVLRAVRGKIQRISIPPGLEARVWRAVTRAQRERGSS